MTNLLPRQRRGRLLVVDDEFEIRRCVERILGPVFHVMSAADGLQALRLIRSMPVFDLVLTDLNMPYLGGLGLHATFLAVDPELARRTVFMSGYAEEPEVALAMKRFGIPLITKPFGMQELRDQLVDILESLGLNNADPAAACDD